MENKAYHAVRTLQDVCQREGKHKELRIFSTLGIRIMGFSVYLKCNITDFSNMYLKCNNP
jgi:hypothetical protein